MVSGTSAAYTSFFLLLSLPLLPWQWLFTLPLASHSETEKPTYHLPMPLDISSCFLHLFPGLDDTEKIPAMSFLAMKCAWIGIGTTLISLSSGFDVNKTMDRAQWRALPCWAEGQPGCCKLNLLLSDERVSFGLLFLKLSFVTCATYL